MDLKADLRTESPNLVETPKSEKKKDRARDAWISFVGRIVAQAVGAGASVALGLMVLQRAQPETPSQHPASVQPAAVLPQSPPVRRSGETALAVLPLDEFTKQSDQVQLADAMTEALIANLVQIDGLRVISRNSMRYKTKPPDDSRRRARAARGPRRRGVRATGWGSRADHREADRRTDR